MKRIDQVRGIGPAREGLTCAVMAGVIDDPYGMYGVVGMGTRVWHLYTTDDESISILRSWFNRQCAGGILADYLQEHTDRFTVTLEGRDIISVICAYLREWDFQSYLEEKPC